ncbi:MAG: hypothetical protein JXA13_08135 [Anaerolineales bacterium]|nr:hypothetical protein [Anaerolineales bacterium]
MSPFDRILLLITGLLAAYQIAYGLDGLPVVVVIAYTTAFGVLLVAGLLLVILGFEILDAPVVVIVSTLIPLSLATGLIWEHLISFRAIYLLFAILGFIAVSLSRLIPMQGKLPPILLAVVHGIAGMTIFLLPIILSISGQTTPGFVLVGVGGALIGVGGLLLAFLKSGKPVFSQKTILTILPGLLFLMTISFVAGFKSG